MVNFEAPPEYVALAQLQCALSSSVQNVELLVDGLVKRGLDVNYGLPPASAVANHSPELVGWTALHFAIKAEQLQAIVYILQCGAKVTITDSHSFSPIRLAIECLERGLRRKGVLQHSVVEGLLEAQYEQNDTSNPSCKLGLSHLHIACMVNDARMVEFLLRSGADADAPVSAASPRLAGFRPVHVAVRYGAAESLRLLLGHGADAGAREARGLSPLQLLIKYNQQLADLSNGRPSEHRLAYERTMKLLLDHWGAAAGSLLDEDGLGRLHVAASMGDSAMLLEALNENPEIDVNAAISEKSPIWPGYTPLHFAARCGFDAVKILAERGANLAKPDASGLAPFDLCLDRYEPKVLGEIMSLDETLKSITFTSSPLATLCGAIASLQSVDDLERFLSKMRTVNDPVSLSSPLWPGCTLLHLVVTLMHPRPNEDYWRNLSDDFGLNPGSRKNTYNVLARLLYFQADPVAQDARKFTPVHLAFRQCKPIALEYLLDRIFYSRKIPMHDNVTDQDGLSLFHIISAAGFDEAFAYLSKHKVDVNVRTTSGIRFYFESKELYVSPGSTPLHFAVTCDSTLITLLIDLGADLLAVNSDGLTPLLLAFIGTSSNNFGRCHINRLLSASSELKFEPMSTIGLSHFHVACWANNVRAVSSFLGQVDVNEKINCVSTNNLAEYPRALRESLMLTDYEGYTPLHIAVQSESLGVLRVLVEYGADVHARNARGLSPLHMALTMTSTNVEKMLQILTMPVYDPRSNVPDRGLIDDYGVTALHIACRRLDSEGVERLLDAGCDVNAQIAMHSPFCAGDTPLHVLSWTNELEKSRRAKTAEIANAIAKLLIAQGADIATPNAISITPLHAVANTIDSDANLPSIYLGNTLKNYNVNPVNNEGLSFLHIAAVVNNTEVVNRLCTQGADVNRPVDYFAEAQGGRGPLHFAAMFGKPETVQLLIEKGAKVNAKDRRGCTPLHVFCENSKNCEENLIPKLCEYGADVNAQDVWGRTPLEILLESPFEQPRVICLMRHGARLNSVNPQSGNSLFSIALSERKRYLPVILNYADVLSVMDDGSTALHNIVRGQVLESSVGVNYYSCVIEELLTRGCYINARDKQGRTALHVAVEHDNYTGVCSLLAAGINANIADNAGNVPLNLSSRYERIRVALLLYLHKLMLLGLTLSEPNRRLYEEARIQGFPPNDSRYLQMRLREEINNLAGPEQQGNLSLRELLTERTIGEYPTMPRSRRDAIVQQLASPELYTRSNILRGPIRYQYRRILERIELHVPAMRALDFIMGDNAVPDPCIEKIVSFLNNEDLKAMIVVRRTTKRKAGNDECTKKKGKSESS